MYGTHKVGCEGVQTGTGLATMNSLAVHAHEETFEVSVITKVRSIRDHAELTDHAEAPSGGGGGAAAAIAGVASRAKVVQRTQVFSTQTASNNHPRMGVNKEVTKRVKLEWVATRLVSEKSIPGRP